MQPGGEPLRVVPDGSAYPGGWAAWVGGPVKRIARGDVFVECLDGEGRTGGTPIPPLPKTFDWRGGCAAGVPLDEAAA